MRGWDCCVILEIKFQQFLYISNNVIRVVVDHPLCGKIENRVERLRTLPNMYCLCVVVDCPLCGKIENPT